MEYRISCNIDVIGGWSGVHRYKRVDSTEPIWEFCKLEETPMYRYKFFSLLQSPRIFFFLQIRKIDIPTCVWLVYNFSRLKMFNVVAQHVRTRSQKNSVFCNYARRFFLRYYSIDEERTVLFVKRARPPRDTCYVDLFLFCFF